MLWLLLSGHFHSALLLSLGGVSVAVIVAIAHRMDVVDHEAQPLHLKWRIVPYWMWLLKEILMSAIHVSGVILKRKMPIKPQMLDVYATQKSELGNVIFANSITLTPGTVTVATEGGHFVIHAPDPGSGRRVDDRRHGPARHRGRKRDPAGKGRREGRNAVMFVAATLAHSGHDVHGAGPGHQGADGLRPHPWP